MLRMLEQKSINVAIQSLLLTLLLLVIFTHNVFAVSPPNLPLPPCEVVDDQETGACPVESDILSISASGVFSPGATVNFISSSSVPACDTWAKYTDVWTPSRCYSSVDTLRVSGCYHINLLTKRFEAVECGSLYLDSDQWMKFDYRSDIFRRDGTPRVQPTCGERPDFWTYAYGGPYGFTGPYSDGRYRWLTRGPDALKCDMALSTDRPDGLWGPTWVLVSASIAIEDNDENAPQGYEQAQVFVPLDGDLRDLGPIAGFSQKITGRRVQFENTSVHPTNAFLNYEWNFGDGNTATTRSPRHTYDEAGTYTVNLVVKDPEGDTDEASSAVVVKSELVVDLEKPLTDPEVGEEADIRATLYNYTSSDISDLAFSLNIEEQQVSILSGPKPLLRETLFKDETAVVYYRVKPLRSGRAELVGVARGSLKEGKPVSAEGSTTLLVPPQLDISLSTSVVSETKVGDEVTVTLTLTNNEAVDINNIRVDALGVLPNELLNPVSGPTTETGADPRVNPVSLAAGETTTVSWVYKANKTGSGTLTASISGQNPYTAGLFFSSDEENIAIESAAIAIDNLALRPGSPVPGAFVTLRGSIKNIGTVDITDIDFSLTSTDAAEGPMFEVFQYLLNNLDAEISPRISTLAPGESRDFLIPLSVATDVGELATYRITLSMQGNAKIDGIDVEIKDDAVTAGGLDLSVYWTSILSEVRSYLFNGLLDSVQFFIDKADQLGDSGLFGGTVVGATDGTLNAFQKMGDGILGIPDLIGDAGAALGYTAGFTNDGKAVVSAIREYVNTTSTKEMLVDMANTEEIAALALGDKAVEAVEAVNQWMFSVDTAVTKGDYRKAAELVVEPSVSVALSVGSELAVEKAGAWLIKKVMNDKFTRRYFRGKKRAPENFPDIDSFNDLPDGVPLHVQSIEKSGISLSEHAWMKVIAAEEEVVFVVRPRPKQAIKWAELDLNAKPLPVKKKSVNEMDSEWLGFNSEHQGLVQFKKPIDPNPKFQEAIESGRLSGPDDPEIKKILERYSMQLSEWNSRHEYVAKMNAANGGKGIEVVRYGEKVFTKVSIDSEGFLIFDFNGKRVYSDIDGFHIIDAKTGETISKDKYDRILSKAGAGFDAQHGNTVNSSDIDSRELAELLINKYGNEHTRQGGEGLLFIGGDVTTKGYVDKITILDNGVTGSFEELYGKVAKISYTGQPTP